MAEVVPSSKKSRSLANEPGKGKGSPYPKRVVKLLIADSDEGCRSLLETVFSDRADVYVIPARRGDEALRLAVEQQPDIIILEGLLAGLNGYDLCRALRADKRTAAAKVVMLTAMAQEQDRRNAIAAGIDLYLTKPFSPFVLEERVFGLLDGARQRTAPSARGTFGPPSITFLHSG